MGFKSRWVPNDDSSLDIPGHDKHACTSMVLHGTCGSGQATLRSLFMLINEMCNSTSVIDHGDLSRSSLLQGSRASCLPHPRVEQLLAGGTRIQISVLRLREETPTI